MALALSPATNALSSVIQRLCFPCSHALDTEASVLEWQQLLGSAPLSIAAAKVPLAVLVGQCWKEWTKQNENVPKLRRVPLQWFCMASPSSEVPSDADALLCATVIPEGIKPNLNRILNLIDTRKDNLVSTSADSLWGKTQNYEKIHT